MTSVGIGPLVWLRSIRMAVAFPAVRILSFRSPAS